MLIQILKRANYTNPQSFYLSPKYGFDHADMCSHVYPAHTHSHLMPACAEILIHFSFP